MGALMKRFIGCSLNTGPRDPAELKAVLCAVCACFLFIGFLTVAQRLGPGRGHHINRNRMQIVSSAPPVPLENPPVPEAPPPPRPPDGNDRFRVVPRNFAQVDFRNRSYGNYTFADGEIAQLTLNSGRFIRTNTSSDWFDYIDTVYTDLTGDGIREAIVLLNHLECGPSCDGGKSLIYVYSSNYVTEGVNELLRYESGSGLKGCSVRSLNVKNEKLSVELFGHCSNLSGPPINGTSPEAQMTRVDFRFDGEYLLPGKKTYFRMPDRDEVNWGVQIKIDEDQSIAAGVRTRVPL